MLFNGRFQGRIINGVCLATIVAAGIIGIWIKAAVIVDGGPAELTADSRLDIVSNAFSKMGVREIGRMNLIEGGTYRAAGFRHPQCDGRLLVVPLIRNAEFVGLRELLAGKTTYTVNGTNYANVPSLALLMDTVLRRLPGNTDRLPPIAWTEVGDCRLAEMMSVE